MQKRSDFAKQFDIIVKQEIKNYQDSLNFVLQSINEIRISIQDLQKECVGQYSRIHSQHVDFKIELNSLKNSYLNLNGSFLKNHQELSLKNETISNKISDLNSIFLNKINSDNNFDNRFECLRTKHYSLEVKVESQNQLFKNSVDDLLVKLRQEIQKAKKEILDLPTETSEVKKHLEEKISSHAIDVAGIMRELKFYKHDNMVTEKKIENIYTLIERLQKSGVENEPS